MVKTVYQMHTVNLRICSNILNNVTPFHSFCHNAEDTIACIIRVPDPKYPL